MVDWKLWRDTPCLRTPGANRKWRLTERRFSTCSSLKEGTRSLTATLTVQSKGWQLPVTYGGGWTLITLVISSRLSNGSDVVDDDEGVPEESRKDVISTTLVTVVMPVIVSEVLSRELCAAEE